jgi:serine/threonine protein kinase
MIGKGGFGRVWKVSDKKTKNVYAMKVMDKAKIITKKSVGSIMN